jgi:hypothetical protein
LGPFDDGSNKTLPNAVSFHGKAQARHFQSTLQRRKNRRPARFNETRPGIVTESVKSLYQKPLYMPLWVTPKINLANKGNVINPSYSPHEGMLIRLSPEINNCSTRSLTRAV